MMKIESIRQHHAQLRALRWLQGKAEDQLVKAFIQVHVESLERIGYPIDSNGTQLEAPEVKKPRRKKPIDFPPLENQIDIEEALKERNHVA